MPNNEDRRPPGQRDGEKPQQSGCSNVTAEAQPGPRIPRMGGSR